MLISKNWLSNVIVYIKFFAIVVPSFFVTSYAFSSAEVFQRDLFNSDWYYSENPSAGEKEKRVEWQPVTLPHTWNAKDTVDAEPGYRRAASWYKKTFKLSGKADRYILHFEASNMETDVYLNGQMVGQHVGGYIGFDVELTEHIKKRGWNELLVRVSNEFNPHLIPSQKSDFFIHGGITRDVWLEYKNSTFIERAEITAPKIAQGDARSEIKVVVDSESAGSSTLRVSVRDADGSMVAKNESAVEYSQGLSEHSLTTADFEDVKLWSPSEPHLYQFEIALVDEKSVLDEHSSQFGFRWFELEAGVGFKVNGERLLLRGTHRHEEMGGLGAALSNEQHYADMSVIKDMGANMVRLGHYPQDPTVYKAANELGLIVWDELPWCRGGKGDDQWEKNTEYLLKQQLNQNFNHPSVAFWSLGNEMYWEADFEGGGDDSRILPYLKKLNSYVKERDPSRLTTLRKYYPGAEVVDIFSPSIWAGWYGGAYGQYESALKIFMKRYPNFIHMEYGGSSHVGRHVESPIGKEGMLGAQVSVEEAVNQAVVTSVAKASDWNENYMVDLFDWYLGVSESLSGLTGTAQWAVRDFGTPLRPENPIPYVNQKGLFDRMGKPKDAYYVFASYWAKEPICYIESHSWTVRYGPKEGRQVDVFCNTHSAELFLNGEPLGEKDRNQESFPASGLSWSVPFVEGKNTLRVKGMNDAGEAVAEDQYTLLYHVGEPAKFAKVILNKTLLANGNVLIEAQAVDAQGRRVTDFSERVYFSDLNGTGALLANYGTPTRTASIEFASGYAAIEAQLVDGKETVVEAKTQNFKGVFLTLNSSDFESK